MRRACELAVRGSGSTSPNPLVGAVIANGAATLGEGFHRARGEPHAEVEALRDAAARGANPGGATLYVTLEPCDHTGLTPPCSQAIIGAGIARAVIGTRDPNPRTGGAGIARLRDANLVVDIVDDAWSQELIADFAVAVSRTRPYLRLKLAASLDGFVAARPGERHWLTGYEARAYVRELRATHDAVMVGAATVRIDDPQLSVRPPYGRRKAYRRVVAAGREVPSLDGAIFSRLPGYDRTIVLAPAAARARFAPLESAADVAYVGRPDTETLDLTRGLEALRAYGIATVLCEGGPTLAAALLADGLVDRFDWLLAPALLRGPTAVDALAGDGDRVELRFDRVEHLGPDVLISGIPIGGSSCSAG